MLLPAWWHAGQFGHFNFTGVLSQRLVWWAQSICRMFSVTFFCPYTVDKHRALLCLHYLDFRKTHQFGTLSVKLLLSWARHLPLAFFNGGTKSEFSGEQLQTPLFSSSLLPWLIAAVTGTGYWLIFGRRFQIILTVDLVPTTVIPCASGVLAFSAVWAAFGTILVPGLHTVRFAIASQESHRIASQKC